MLNPTFLSWESLILRTSELTVVVPVSDFKNTSRVKVPDRKDKYNTGVEFSIKYKN